MTDLQHHQAERLERAIAAAKTIIEADDLPAYVRAYAIVTDAAIDLLKVLDEPVHRAD